MDLNKVKPYKQHVFNICKLQTQLRKKRKNKEN